MLDTPVIASKGEIKYVEYKQNDLTYKIELNSNLDNIYLCIKNISKIDSFYELEISFSDIQKKNQVFRIYQSSKEFINALEGFIKNKNISIQENQNDLTFNIIVFNMMNGNKENISFNMNKKINNNKDEIIKYLCTKVDTLEKKFDEMNKNYIKLNQNFEDMKINYTKLKEIVDYLKNKEESYFFAWENNSNCQLSNGNKKIKKIKNQGWNTGVKGNNLLKRNEINIFKIRVNHINKDKVGLCFGISKYKSNVNTCDVDWLMNCGDRTYDNYSSFKNEKINEGDIMTFIADLKVGTLEVKKNDISLGKLTDFPTNEDLVPCVSIFYVDDEVEIID